MPLLPRFAHLRRVGDIANQGCWCRADDGAIDIAIGTGGKQVASLDVNPLTGGTDHP